MKLCNMAIQSNVDYLDLNCIQTFLSGGRFFHEEMICGTHTEIVYLTSLPFDSDKHS